MKGPLLSGVAITAGIIVAFAVLADNGRGGQQVSPSPGSESPAVVNQINDGANPAIGSEQAGGGAINPTVDASANHNTTIPSTTWIRKSVVPKPTSKIAEQAEVALDEIKSIEAEIPLQELPNYLSEQTGSPVWLDDRAVSIAKIDPAATTIYLDNMAHPLRTALHKALHPLGLQVVVRNEGIVITADPIAQVRMGVNASRWVNVDEDAARRIETALKQPRSVSFVEETLENALRILSEHYDLRIEIDRKAIEEIGLSSDTLVSVSRQDAKLESILSAILHDLDLAYTVRDERLYVTTMEAEEARLLIRIYWLEGIGLPLAGVANSDELMTLIQSTIVPDTWEPLGGPSTMTPITQGLRPALVVAATFNVHRQIDAMLSRLRDAHFGPDPVMQAVEVPAVPTPPNRNAVGAMDGSGFGGGGMGGGFGGPGGGGGFF